MIKVDVTRKDVDSATSYLTQNPKHRYDIHDPISRAVKRMIVNDPRWCSPRVAENKLILLPRSKYAKLTPIEIKLDNKVVKHSNRFQKIAKGGFKETSKLKELYDFSFSLKGVSIKSGRIVV